MIENLQRNAWEYHYFEMPDPTPGALTYPFVLSLILSPDDDTDDDDTGLVPQLDDIEVQVRLADCATASPPGDDEEGVVRTISGSELTITIGAERLFTVLNDCEQIVLN